MAAVAPLRNTRTDAALVSHHDSALLSSQLQPGALIPSGALSRLCQSHAWRRSSLPTVYIGPHPSMLPHLLSSSGRHPANSFAQDGAPIVAGHIYVAPPDYHTLLGTDAIYFGSGTKGPLHPARG